MATTDLRGRLHQSWGWLLALGLVLILFGGLILTTPLGVITATLTTEIWIAAAFVVAGVLQLAHGLKAEGWSARSWQMLGGVAFIIGGLLIFVYPTLGLVSITMIVAATLVALGLRPTLLADCGVAGVHRLLASADELAETDAAVVVAGMEGALASLVGGITPAPVVAVPTSTGYGAALEGVTALLAMHASCAAGITVVGIDNGFGAACAVARMLP